MARTRASTASVLVLVPRACGPAQSGEPAAGSLSRAAGQLQSRVRERRGMHRSRHKTTRSGIRAPIQRRSARKPAAEFVNCAAAPTLKRCVSSVSFEMSNGRVWFRKILTSMGQLANGSANTMQHPLSFRATWAEPPCAVAIERTIARPRPHPDPGAVVPSG